VSKIAQNQGDQIGRIFADWVIVFLGHFFFKLEMYPQFLGYFCTPKKQQKFALATFRAIFSQTHLVTLPRMLPNPFLSIL
jgi:hypothetical protein